MIIQWLGLSAVKIQTKGQGEDLVIALDPFADEGSLKMPRFQADIITASSNHKEHANFEAIRGEPFAIVHPGEYETRGIFIYGISGINSSGKEKNQNTIYKIIAEDISVAHLGRLDKILTDEQIDQLGNVDILLLPVGGNGVLDDKKAMEVASQLEPRIIIPLHYKTGEQKTDLADAGNYLKHCGLKSETQEKLRVVKKDLLAEDTKVIVLTI
ncbi:MAG: MBL fold metallo-hydrolase [Candidatus Buchananbacteria bacterium]